MGHRERSDRVEVRWGLDSLVGAEDSWGLDRMIVGVAVHIAGLDHNALLVVHSRSADLVEVESRCEVCQRRHHGRRKN